MGTGACNMPEIRLEEGSGGRLRGAGGAWVFSPVFRSSRIHGGSSHLLQVPHPNRGCLGPTAPPSRASPPPILQTQILRVKNDRKMS